MCFKRLVLNVCILSVGLTENDMLSDHWTAAILGPRTTVYGLKLVVNVYDILLVTLQSGLLLRVITHQRTERRQPVAVMRNMGFYIESRVGESDCLLD